MREALIAIADEMRAARPGSFMDALQWQDLEHDRAEVGDELNGVEYDLTRLRVLAFVRTLRRHREAEGGNESKDAVLAQRLATAYFRHRDRDPALFDDTIPCLNSLRPRYRLGLVSNGSSCPRPSAWAATSRP